VPKCTRAVFHHSGCGGLFRQAPPSNRGQSVSNLGRCVYSPEAHRPGLPFLSAGAAKWLRLERLPAYAPDLNPDEGIWNYLKRVELANPCSLNLNELSLKLQEAMRRLRRKPRVIQACMAGAGLAI